MFSSMRDITINDAIMNMPRGWVVVYNDGSVVTEDEKDWSEVNRKDIKVLALKWHNKWWTIRDKTSYIQMKRGSMLVSAAGSVVSDVMCEERCIGYYDENGNKILYRVNEHTGQMRLDVQEPKR